MQVTMNQVTGSHHIVDSDGARHNLPGPFRSMQQIVEANAAAGQHWFEPEALRFFGCRLSKRIFGGRIFISSERLVVPGVNESWPRRYTIRVVTDGGDVRTVGDFQEYPSLVQAQEAAVRMTH
jgi:hypothetical protein